MSVFDQIPQRDLTPTSTQKTYGTLPEKHSVMNGVHEDDIQTAWTGSTWFWIVFVPIVVFVLLMALTPTFIEMRNPGKANESLNPSAVLLWTLVITLIIWSLFWGFSKCKTC